MYDTFYQSQSVVILRHTTDVQHMPDNYGASGTLRFIMYTNVLNKALEQFGTITMHIPHSYLISQIFASLMPQIIPIRPSVPCEPEFYSCISLEAVQVQHEKVCA